jgi:MFS transporter, ACS family, tartrate transporter
MNGHDQVFLKCAWRLIPFMMLLYLLNFLDRVNVGFAALTMNRDLGFTPEIYGFGAGILFFSYAFFQLPANLVFERLGARRWVFLMLAAWGVISAANAFAQGAASFYVLRFLLGAAEAGFFPGMIFYLTLWFPQAYRARFIAMFMTAQPFAFIIGGPLSSLILGMDGVADLRGWQWLFLIEGLPAALLAFAVLRLLPDGPAAASWLTPGEKAEIAERLASEDTTERRELGPALLDARVWALGLVGFGQNCAAYGVGLWFPQMVQAMGFSNRATGFVVALPFVAVMLAMVLWGRSSDSRGERVWHVALPFLLAAAGLMAASVAPSDFLVLAVLTVALISLDAGMGVFWTLPSSFLSGRAAAGSIALIRTISALGGFAGPSIVGLLLGGTGDYAAAMAALGCGLVAAALLVLGVGRAIGSRKVQLVLRGPP